MSGFDEKICERIKLIMQEEGLKQRELAVKTGMAQSSISAILNGVRSPILLVDAMTEKMGIMRGWLLTGVGYKYNIETNIELANISTDSENISMTDKIAIMKEIDAMYNRHQELLQEAEAIMKTIIDLNSKILFWGIDIHQVGE